MPTHITAKKHFSQNFLVDEQARQKVLAGMKQICDISDLPVIEIGPGQGDVTKFAIEWNKNYTALEIDPEAISWLTDNLDSTKFELIHCDVMDIIDQQFQRLQNNNDQKSVNLTNKKAKSHNDSTKFEFPENFSLISSLPYHIGSRLLVDCGVLFPKINFGIIHQKEVVMKIKKESNFTFFGAWLNLFWNCKHCFDLPKHCFNPQPKVVSAFLQGYSKNSQELDWLNTSSKRLIAKNTLKVLFGFPNKTLANNLKSLDWNTQKILKFLSNHCDNNANTRLSWDNYTYILEQVVKNQNL